VLNPTDPRSIASGAPDGVGDDVGPHLRRLLDRQTPTAVQFGLDRIRALLRELGDPHLRYRAIHVAGTNGKGSVAATAESILREAGRRTGLYTSPHLLAFAERIAIDGTPASADLLESVAADVLPAAASVDATFFEAVTALGFAVFARAGVQDAVVEVGLGGRLDATNVLGADVAVITSIALDHADYLGSDPAGIAREKAGIIAEGAAVVIGDVRGAPRRELLLAAERRAARALVFGEAYAAEQVRETPDGIELTYRSASRSEGLRLASPLRGAHQAVNVAAAVAAVDAFTLAGPGAVPVPADAVARGVAGVRWPGRFQVEGPASRGEPAHVYDIAHNPAAAMQLAGLLERALSRGELERPVVLLAAVLGDKDWRAVLGPLLAVTDDAVLTDAPSAPAGRRWKLQSAAAELSRRAPLTVEPEFGCALERARKLAGEGTVLVTGSCYTVGDALRRRAARSPDDEALIAG
jgi:dihydrofolate synthase/folylpolyglutamate synthase